MSTKLIKITPSDLARFPVVVQALDPFWIPVSLFRQILGSRQSLKHGRKTNKEKAREWRRALVYAEQIVIPLSNLLSGVTINDYQSTADRNNFKKLLNDKTIIPYLTTQTNLAPNTYQFFSVKAWLDTIDNIETSCLRFSWGSQKKLFQDLNNTFHRQILSLHAEIDYFKIFSHFTVDESRKIEFEIQLSALSSFAYQLSQEGKYVSRNELYTKFVTASGSNPFELHIDTKRPFVAELKQFIDCAYHNSFTNAIGAYLLMPIGDTEMFFFTNRNFGDEYFKMSHQTRRLSFFQKKAFGVALPLLNTYNLHDLSLENVITIRNSNEWHTYLQKLHDYLSDSENYHQHLPELKSRIQRLNSHINKVFLGE